MRTNTYGSTCRGNKVYLHIFDTKARPLVLPPLPKKILRSSMLNGGEVKVTQTDQAVTVEVGPYDFQTPTTIVVLELESSAEELTPIGEVPVNRNVRVRSSNENPSTDRFASDGDMSTFWKADGKAAQPWLEYDLGSEKSISRAILFEGAYEGECSNIHQMQIEAKSGEQWTLVSDVFAWAKDGNPVFDEWPMSVSHPEIRFAPVKARYIRLKLARVTGVPLIHEFQLYER
jgi:alpha-L-fucosidase